MVDHPNQYRARSHSCEWLFCLLLCSLLLAGCERGPDVLQLQGATMGTTWNVTLVESPQGLDRDSAQSLVQARLDAVNASMSTYRADSEISRFNDTPVGEWFAVSELFLRVLDAALQVGEASGGGYDISVGPLVDLWGFGAAGIKLEPPAPDDVKAVLPRVGQGALAVEYEAGRIRRDSAIALDVSSIAKGFGVDEVVAALVQAGVTRYLVEVGGEMRVAGASPRGDAWRIAIEQPQAGGMDIAQAISLPAGAIATSGDYRNYFEADGKRYSHTIDPRTGYPVTHDLASVTVVHEQAMLADAWATALSVLGAEEGREVAQQAGLAVYFIRRTPEGFVPSYTPAFEAYLESSTEKRAGS